MEVARGTRQSDAGDAQRACFAVLKLFQNIVCSVFCLFLTLGLTLSSGLEYSDSIIAYCNLNLQDLSNALTSAS
ncbi:hypothetical protein AAY473_027277 [Plecturocebus cupreus]